MTILVVLNLQASVVFVFYLGNSVALTLFALTVIYSIVSLRGKVNLKVEEKIQCFQRVRK